MASAGDFGTSSSSHLYAGVLAVLHNPFRVFLPSILLFLYCFCETRARATVRRASVRETILRLEIRKFLQPFSLVSYNRNRVQLPNTVYSDDDALGVLYIIIIILLSYVAGINLYILRSVRDEIQFRVYLVENVISNKKDAFIIPTLRRENFTRVRDLYFVC
jgi:hypothetical protein